MIGNYMLRRTKHSTIEVVAPKEEEKMTQWVQNVPRLGLYFNSSRWYRITVLLTYIFVL
jgi:hypothetical protein